MTARWISKKGVNGKVRRIPVQGGRAKGMRGKEQSLDDITNNLEWIEDTGFAFSDAGEDKAKVYTTGYEGYYLEVFPMKLVNKNLKGWEYQIINEDKGIEYISGVESDGPSAKTPKEAMEWAASTLRTYLE
jgi:hypothetical protein